jgi:hypothetical protein
MNNASAIKNSTIALFIGIISLALFAESSIPYFYAEHKCKPQNKFLGQIIYTPDQDMYFSFIRQSRDGHFVFNNRLTYLPNKPVFVNLQFWLIGAIQRVTGLSENGIYYVWRYLGILLLTIGIVLLARIVLPTPRQVFACVALVLFTGGFGFLFALLNSAHLIGLEAAHAGILDMKFGMLPFQQAMTNPNFSFPHGLILIAYSLFLLGEQKNSTKLYIWSGIFFCIIGLVRPYDILPPFVVFPAYLLITNGSFKFQWKQLFIKLLPLFMLVPVLLYNFWLFKVNDIFKYWSTQGLNANSIPTVPWHYSAYGIVGILAIIRVAQLKNNPLSRTDKFLLTWFLLTFSLIQLGKYFPVIGWSPQIGVYLAVPLALLGCSIKYRPDFPKLRFYGIFTVVAACAIISNIFIVLYYCKNFTDKDKTPTFYANKNEVAAFDWLNKNTPESTVVLAMPSTSLRIAKYTSDNVVAAHYSVTPHYAESAAIASSLFADSVLGRPQLPAVEKLNVSYIYIGPSETQANSVRVPNDGALTQVYKNDLVTIYKVTQ